MVLVPWESMSINLIGTHLLKIILVRAQLKVEEQSIVD